MTIREKAHEQIHGLINAHERYQKVCEYSSAKLLFKRIASQGFVFVVDLDDPDTVAKLADKYFMTGELEGCSRCMDIGDVHNPSYALSYVNCWDYSEDEFFPAEDTESDD